LMAYALNPEAEEVIVLLKKVGVGPLRRWLMSSRIKKRKGRTRQMKNMTNSRGEREDEGLLEEE